LTGSNASADASSIGGSQGAGQDAVVSSCRADQRTEPGMTRLLAKRHEQYRSIGSRYQLRKDWAPMSQFDSRLTTTIHLHQDRVTS